MELFLKAIIVLVASTFIQRFISFARYKNLLDNNSVIRLKLKDYREFSWDGLISGFLSAIIGVICYSSHDQKLILQSMLAIAFVSIFNCFISPVNYLLIDSNGIRRGYNQRSIKWQIISGIARSKEYSNVIIITLKTGKPVEIYGDKADFDQLVLTVKELNRDIYDRCFLNLNDNH